MTDICCVICFAPVVDNLQCRQCLKGFCETCLTNWLKQNASCPSCRFDGPAPFTHSAALQALADASNVACEYGCGVVHRWADRAAHRQHCDKARLACPFKPCTFVGPAADVDLHAFKCPHARTFELSSRVQAVLDAPSNQGAPLSMAAMKNLLSTCGGLDRARAAPAAATAAANSHSAADAGDGTLLHIVRTTDTLQGLALRYGTDRETLRRLNRLVRDSDLHAFPSVRVPQPPPPPPCTQAEGADPNAPPAGDVAGSSSPSADDPLDHVPLETLLALQKRNATKALMMTAKVDAPEAVSYLHLNDYCFADAQENIKADRAWEKEHAQKKPVTFAQFAALARQTRREHTCHGCEGPLCPKKRACAHCQRVFCKVCCAKYGECARVLPASAEAAAAAAVCNACYDAHTATPAARAVSAAKLSG